MARAALPTEEDLYMNMIVVEVEGHLTKIPRALFARSPVFQAMFSLPQSTASVPEGSDNEHALKLEGIPMSVFKLFVRVGIASEIMRTPIPTDLQCWEYADVYDLAMRWDMQDLCQTIKAGVQLAFCEGYAVRQLFLAARMREKSWVQESVRHFVHGQQTVKQEDIDLLHYETLAKLLAMREAHRANRRFDRNPTGGEVMSHTVRQLVADLELSIEWSDPSKSGTFPTGNKLYHITRDTPYRGANAPRFWV